MTLEYKIRGENIQTTEAIENYVISRLEKLNTYIDESTNPNPIAKINIRKYNEKTFKIEVTVPLKSLTLRAEETRSDLYEATDFVSDKLARQIRKYKTRVNRKSREKGFKGIELTDALPEIAEEANPITVVRRKTLSLKPMDVEEAILQMEMLGHTFFIFKNVDNTENLDIVYRRDDGAYGLIETNDLDSSK
ncbi:MAG: ribosome-associated translation inhibitor RaiA [Lactobacillaceae bacterium]|jgi:ribosomal subunit interface protein|nr:ribosome-associated translation inhibitor RaiA [Lactobacillaceae bacterium]